MIWAAIVVSQGLIGVPEAVRPQLDATCAAWRLAPVIPEIAAEIAVRTPTWPPNLLPGDFNADRETDVAVLIECGGTVHLLAFLSGPSGFTRHALEEPLPYDARQFLHLIRQDYGRDAIGVEYEAVGGHAWLYRDGRWQSVRR